MALPSIPVTHFPIKTKYINKLTARPYLTGEESILLQVKDSKDPDEILEAVKQVVKACIVEPADIDVSTIPVFVLEYIFLKMRQHANGELVEMSYRCNNKVPQDIGADATVMTSCGHEMKVTLDLRNADIVEPEGHKRVFEVGGGIGIELEYPSLNLSERLEKPDDVLETIAMSIKTIYQGDEVWTADQHTKEELITFAKGISPKVRLEITDTFYNRLPALTSVLKPKCEKCGHQHEIELTGLNDHFS
jgi:hypothetical protein